jgi:hypothetical protein
MFKKLQKSVINKNKLLMANFNKRRVNKTPSKIIFPNRPNLTFANIIVNMNSSPNFSNVDNWNNSYFTTEVYNNSFTSKSKNNLNNIIKSEFEPRNSNINILSMVINGIVSLKANDLLNYCMKLIEIITYIRDNPDKTNIEINTEMNKDLLVIIYQAYFHIFPNHSIISTLLKDDANNGKSLFKRIHSVYILYLLSGIIYINYNIKSGNKQFLDFLKQFILKEKCKDVKCNLCSHINKFELNYMNLSAQSSQNQNSFIQKPSVIKIVGKCMKKNNNISNNNFNRNNKIYNIRQKIKNEIINNSNDNIMKIKNKNSQIHYKDKSFNRNVKGYCSHIVSERNNKKILNMKRFNNEVAGNISNTKKFFYSQIVKANDNEKNNFFNESFNIKEKSISKSKYYVHKTEYNLLDNSYNKYYADKSESKDKKFLTEKNDSKNKKKIKDSNYSNLIQDIKIKLYKNNKNIKNTGKDKNIDSKSISKDKKINTYNNNKIIEINKKEINLLCKSAKIKNSSDTKSKKENKNNINLENYFCNCKKNEMEFLELNSNINKSSMVIKENINAIEKEIKDFKNHNNYIKNQLYYIFNKNKAY